VEGSGYGRTGMGGDIDDKVTINLGRLGIVGHLATIDDELVCHLVSLWDKDGGLQSNRACGWGGESRPAVNRDVVTRESGRMEGKWRCQA
jgi:hypothetical protein